MEVLIKLCEKYDGEIYQNGIRQYENYLPLNMVNDIKASLFYKQKNIIIKKVVRFNPYYIYMPIENKKNIQILIRHKTVLNSLRNWIGKGSQVIGQYELVGEEIYINRLQRNKQLMKSIAENDLTIEVTSKPHPAILLKPFHGIENVRKGEEYFEILYKLEAQLENRARY